MLRIIHDNNTLPHQWRVSPAGKFQFGMIGQLGLSGNVIVCGVSDGRAPIGIIDDSRTDAYSTSVTDEVHIVTVPNARESNGKWYSTFPVMTNLDNPNIIQSSFVCQNYEDFTLIPKNGVMIFPEGTQLNFSNNTQGIPDSIKFIVRYAFQIPYIPGEDTTSGSGMVTIWTSNIICAVDQFDTTAQYAVNAILFSGLDGKITTQQLDSSYPPIGICTSPNSTTFSWVEWKTFF